MVHANDYDRIRQAKKKDVTERRTPNILRIARTGIAVHMQNAAWGSRNIERRVRSCFVTRCRCQHCEGQVVRRAGR
jgi:hypothetical protein